MKTTSRLKKLKARLYLRMCDCDGVCSHCPEVQAEICMNEKKRPVKVGSISVLFILLSFTASAQVFPTMEPTFLRPGVLYRAPGQLAPYGHVWVGMIAPRLVLHAYNVKIGLGASYTVHNAKERSSLYLFAGMNAQHFWQVREGLALDNIHRVSIECGIGVQSGRVTVIALTDPDNWETCFGLWISPRWKCNVKGRRDVCPR